MSQLAALDKQCKVRWLGSRRGHCFDSRFSGSDAILRFPCALIVHSCVPRYHATCSHLSLQMTCCRSRPPRRHLASADERNRFPSEVPHIPQHAHLQIEAKLCLSLTSFWRKSLILSPRGYAVPVLSVASLFFRSISDHKNGTFCNAVYYPLRYLLLSFHVSYAEHPITVNK
jgi:hypothetical protein